MDYAPEPEPDLSGTFQLTVNARPAAIVCINTNELCAATPWVERLEAGTYRVEIASQSDVSDIQAFTVPLEADKRVCWDFNTGAKCK
jgi:hypothetical protein